MFEFLFSGKNGLFYVLLIVVGITLAVVLLCALLPVNTCTPAMFGMGSSEYEVVPHRIRAGGLIGWFSAFIGLYGIGYALLISSYTKNLYWYGGGINPYFVLPALVLILLVIGLLLSTVYAGREKAIIRHIQTYGFNYDAEVQVVAAYVRVGIGKPYALVRKIIAVLLGGVVLGCMIAYQFFFSPFNRLYVQSLNSSEDRYGQIIYDLSELFGEPDEYDKETETYFYYSGEFKKSIKRLRELEIQLEDAIEAGDLEKMDSISRAGETLSAQMMTMTHQCLQVQKKYDDEKGVYKVMFMLDKTRNLAKVNTRKTVSKLKLVGDKFGSREVQRGDAPTDMYVKIFYGDGSYYFGAIPQSAFTRMFSEISSTSDYGTLRWEDAWGVYSVDIRVKGSADDSSTDDPLPDGMSGNYNGIQYRVERIQDSNMFKLTLVGGNGDSDAPWRKYSDQIIIAELTNVGSFHADDYENLTDVVLVDGNPNTGFVNLGNITDIWLDFYIIASEEYIAQIEQEYNLHIHNEGTWAYVDGVPTANT